MDLWVEYQTDFTSPSGYSRAARNHVRALLERGVRVSGIPNKHDVTNVVLDQFWAKNMDKVLNDERGAPIKIWHETPEFFEPHPAQYNIAMLTFEADKIPAHDVGGNPRNNWVRQLNRMDEIWTFASFMIDVFRHSGVKDSIPIHVFPHPIDIGQYTTDVKPMQLYDHTRKPIPDDTFVFMSVFQWSARKSPYRLLSTYLGEFSKNDNVCLMVKTYSRDFSPQSRKVVVDQIQDFKKYVRREGGLPPVYFHMEPIPDGQMHSFLSAADVGVSTAYAEGFGLPIQEHMALGIPCIVPQSSSFPDFVNEENGWLTPTFPVPIFGQQFPWYEVQMNWWEIQACEMQKHMREAYENRELVKKKGEAARAFVKANHSLKTVGSQMEIRLEKIAKAL